MAEQEIRYASREANTSAHDHVHVWRVPPAKVERFGVKFHGDQVCWIGSLSDLLYSCAVTEFIELFGHDILPPNGECLPFKIIRSE